MGDAGELWQRMNFSLKIERMVGLESGVATVENSMVVPQKVKHRITTWDFPGGTVVKNPPANAGDTVRSLVREDLTCRGATKPVRHNY